MDDSLRKAAREGNVSDLYRLIEEDGNVLRRFDAVEFIETPLHVAAAEGCIDFAMEIMSLKPSFARKLNKQGLSPIHLAVENGHKELALLLFESAKDLVRVRGKKGETPLHYVITRETNQLELLSRFLEDCPDCIRDVTNEKQTALHIAARNNKEEALQLLCQVLRNKNYHTDLVNLKDGNGDTALHIAARNNQHEMVKLLLKYKADKHVTNQAGSTALDVAHQLYNKESSNILRGCLFPGLQNSKNKLQRQFFMYVTKASSVIFHDMDNISSEDRNALLVILGLLLTATFQASLSPPGSVWQGDSSSNSDSNDRQKVGKSVMDPSNFFLFYIPTYLVFIATLFLTLSLLKPFPRGFRSILQVLLAFLARCFDQSILFQAPADSIVIILNLISGSVFLLMLLLCIVHRVSKISVSILGCWFFPAYLFDIFGQSYKYQSVVYVLQGCFLFLLLHDEFWKGTLLVVGYYLLVVEFMDPSNFVNQPYSNWLNPISSPDPIIILPCSWFFLGLCQFCIKRCNENFSA